MTAVVLRPRRAADIPALVDVLREQQSTSRYPFRDPLPIHPAALALYTSTGWRKVMRVRPEWLVSVMADEGPDVTVMVHAGPT